MNPQVNIKLILSAIATVNNPAIVTKIAQRKRIGSPIFAEQEVKRYTETRQGHAPAYFYGSQQLWQLRSQLEQTLGKKFMPQKFDDFVLSQTFLMPKVMQE